MEGVRGAGAVPEPYFHDSCGFFPDLPFRFALRIPGDGRFNQKEFEVIPARGL